MTCAKLINRAAFADMAGVSSAAITKACKNSLQPALVGKRIDANHPAAKAYIKSKLEPEIRATGYDPYFDQAVELCRKKERYSIRFIKASFKIGTPRATKIVALMKVAGVIPEPGEPPPKIVIQKKPQRTISGHTAKNNTKKSAALANIHTEETVHEVPEDLTTFARMTLTKLIERFGTDVAFLDWLKALKEIEMISEKRLKNAKTKGELVHRDLIKLGIIEPIDEVFVNLLSDGARTLATRVPAKAQSGESSIEIENYISDYMGKFIKKAKANVARVLKDVEA